MFTVLSSDGGALQAPPPLLAPKNPIHHPYISLAVVRILLMGLRVVRTVKQLHLEGIALALLLGQRVCSFG